MISIVELNSSSVTKWAGFRITDPGRLTMPSIFSNSDFPNSINDATESKDLASTGAETVSYTHLTLPTKA